MIFDILYEGGVRCWALNVSGLGILELAYVRVLVDL